MKKSFIYLASALIVALVVLTCGLSFFAVQLQQKDLDSISTSVAQTMVALNQQYQPTPLSNANLIATAVAQTVALNPQSQACAAAAPISTPTPYQYVAITPTAIPYPCNSSATMVSETYPDHTHLDINQYFNKSWRLKNVGTCTWSTGYRLAFYSGNSMSAPSYVNMSYAVPPGGIVDIVVPMRAPGTAGVYTGYWGLYTNPNVLLFGKVWVTIDVDAAGPAPTATNPAPTATNPPPANCGDGVIDLGEVCDDGLLNSDTVPDACRTDCTPADCGDGVIDTGEQCDGITLPAGVPAGTACNACVLGPYCGDGVIDLGEVCDDGLLNSDTEPGVCRTDCMSSNFVTSVNLTVTTPFCCMTPCLVPTDITVSFQADITTNAAGIVTYYWARKETTNTALDSLVFAGAGTQTVTLDWTILGVVTGGFIPIRDYWVQIYIDNPNHQFFPDIHFPIFPGGPCY